MEIDAFKAQYYFFDPLEFGRVFVFIDFGNVRPWAKDFWPEENKFRISIEVDIIKLAKVCNWVSPLKKFFYYGHFSEDQGKDKHNKSVWRIDKAGRAGFQVKTKIIKMVPHYDEDGTFVGKFPKCNFDVEMTMTMLQKIDKYDTVMLFSGDSDFGGLLGYLKSKGKKVVIVCTRNRMSTELQTAADKFIPAENLAQFLQYSPKTNPPEQ
ncbi:MAG: hypothetical protein A3G52_02400 [Candidatus Taylorbacteria bacterium RIFCSPLOWO2_12_FULL_43_20]|uniref:NYN domain-containing protein n=1 Tax=Candidatus Taylorbacteria bacterium RIFCSPLOWO2_12_FULL_43_20 TaxID=1802332 RepID=A0A1G2P4P6_9BACT|nr:MAG: hypothetical protein A3H58_00370 [Candidatus Taylorbacteria bacterium RIFCSPLOWO2_02_FULL_43_22b]OHA42541.1 MAG: hypothetical protein A3G52_02400 [Candidatus Taylorbacteria bacterium RIFCSPLOWO2_12_FULL_43_20]